LVKPPYGFPVTTPPTKIVGLGRLFRQPGEGHDHAWSTMDHRRTPETPGNVARDAAITQAHDNSQATLITHIRDDQITRTANQRPRRQP
jgi:hypothetical protein